LILNPYGNNVGIGGSTAAYQLDVTGTFRATGAATFSSSVTAQNMYSISDNSEQITIKTATDNNKQLIFGRTTTNAKIIAVTQGVGYVPLCLQPDGGNVLIGTTTDSGAKLQVAGSGTFSGTSLKLGDQSDIVATSGITLGNDASTIEMVASTYANGYGAKFEQLDPSDGSTYTVLYGRANSLSWTERLRVNNSTGAATFSNSLTTGDNIAMTAGEFYYGGVASGQKLRTYTSGASGSATLNYAFWNGSAWAIKSTLDYNGAATFSSSVQTGNNITVNSSTYNWYSSSSVAFRVVDFGQYGSVYSYQDGAYYSGFTNNAYFASGTFDWRYKNTGGASNLYFQNGNLYFETAASGTAGNAMSLSNKFYISQSGNVGIGTTSPTSGKLEIDLDGTTGPALFIKNTNTGVADNYAATIAFNADNGTTNKATLSMIRNGYDEFRISNLVNTGITTFYTNSSERMRITSGGKVNIANTTNTTYALSVYSTAQDTTIQAAGVAPSIRFTDTVTSATYSSLFGMATEANNFTTGSVGGDFAITWSSANSLIFGFSNTSTEKARMTSNGDLLLGTTTTYSGAKLVANGGIRTAAPSGTTAGIWKFGQMANFGVTANRVIYIEVDGVTYTLLASTTV